MNIFNIFGPRKIPVADVADILLYLVDLIVIKRGNKPVREDVDKILLLKNLAQPAQDASAEEIYIHLEKMLAQDYDMETIRSEVRARLNLDLSKMPFAGKFFTKDERDFRELENQASALAARLSRIMGRQNLEKLIRDKTEATLFKGTALTDKGLLDFSAAEFRLFRLPPPWLKLGIRVLNQLVRDLSVL